MGLVGWVWSGQPVSWSDLFMTRFDQFSYDHVYHIGQSKIFCVVNFVNCLNFTYHGK